MDSSQGSRSPGKPAAGREVEAGFERLLKDAMTRRMRAAAGSECLDGETLAAWCEGALTPSERSFVEAHAAGCGRCQDMLAVMARTEPVDAPQHPWSLRQWMMMLAPAATATAAVALWFAIAPPRPAQDTVTQSTAAVDAHAARETGPETEKDAFRDAGGRPAAPSAAAPAGSSVAPAEARDERAAAAREPSSSPADALSRARAAKDGDRSPNLSKASETAKIESARARQEPAAAVEEEKRKLAASVDAAASAISAERKDAKPVTAPVSVTAGAPPIAGQPVVEPPAAALPPPAAPRPASQAAQTPQAAAAAQQADARSDQSQSNQRVQGFTGAGRGGGETRNRAMINEAIDLAPLVVRAADTAVQWRVIAGRIVQQTADNGATWATQYTLDERAFVVAGSAPSPTVAWLVGRAGLVLATADGRVWRRLSFPEPVDLVGVAATGARTATVTTGDRRTFTTADGGASWVAVKN